MPGIAALASAPRPAIPLGEGGGSSDLALKVRRMRIKARAAVNASIPESARMFFEVTWRLSGATSPPTPTIYLCASRQWTVSVLLDAACKAGGVRNPNATTPVSALRLHVFGEGTSVPSGMLGSGGSSDIERSAGAGGSTTRAPLPFSAALADLESSRDLIDGGQICIALGDVLS